jgi:uncharacterized membrane protein
MQSQAAPLYPRAPLYFMLLLGVAFAGFYPSFFGRLAQARWQHHFHGFAATAWVLLLIGQTWLIRSGRRRLHRTVGKLSVVLALAFVVSGALIVQDMLTRDSPFARLFGPRLAFADISSIVFFGFAYGAAIQHRGEKALHARWMAATALPLLPPALARVIGGYLMSHPSFELAFHLSFVVTHLLVIALLVHDWRGGKVRAPYIVLLLVLALQQVSFDLSLKVPAWRAVVDVIAASSHTH